MARDYARKPEAQSRRRGPAATPRKQSKAPARSAVKGVRRPVASTQRGGLSLKWILSLAAVGGFIGFIAYLNSLPAPELPGESAQDPQATGSRQAEDRKTEQKPGFRFYDLLPDSEVVPPKVDEYTPGPGQTSFDYLVQTGSFKTRKDAERQRAQIAFQGLRAYVTQTDLDNGNVWFRVNVGPFSSRSQMNSAVDKLVSINIEPLVRKVPKDTAKNN